MSATDARIERVVDWLKAVLHHEPGMADVSTNAVGAWPNGDLQSLWIDLNALTSLIGNPATGRFMVSGRGSRPTRIVYNDAQLRRLRSLACVAAGVSLSPVDQNNRDGHQLCRDPGLKIVAMLDLDLRRLSQLAADARGGGDVNAVVKRGALLHSDIAMAGPLAAEPIVGTPSLAPQGYVVNTVDGRPVEATAVAMHWEIAAMLLDTVRLSDTGRPAPARDETVRQWYHATSAWMQLTDHLYMGHLKRGALIFPGDPDLQFLLGCLHETFADTLVQSALQSSAFPRGLTLDIADERMELKQAEEAFRRAVDARPDFPGAHLRLGRVIALRGRPADAIAELKLTLAALPSGDNRRYHAELFLGAASSALARYDEAREAYERAAALFPLAQSPLFGLSELARRRGDRRAALDTMQRVFALPNDEQHRVDPWWTYHVDQARNADRLLEDLWRTFRQPRTQR